MVDDGMGDPSPSAVSPRFSPEHGQVLVAFVCAGEQMTDPRIEGEKFHAAANCCDQQPRVGDLSMPENAASAQAEHLVKPKVEWHESVCPVCRIAQQQLGHLTDTDRSTG